MDAVIRSHGMNRTVILSALLILTIPGDVLWACVLTLKHNYTHSSGNNRAVDNWKLTVWEGGRNKHVQYNILCIPILNL